MPVGRQSELLQHTGALGGRPRCCLGCCRCGRSTTMRTLRLYGSRPSPDTFTPPAPAPRCRG